MKKFSFLLVSFLVLFLASCKNSFSDNSNTAYITISVDEERTVFPTFSVTAMTDLVLSGKHNGNTIVLGEFDTVHQLLNKKIPIETGTWDFSFSAVIGKSRFVSNIDSYNITIGNHSLIFHFDLIEEDIKTQEGKGTLDIKLDLPAINDINHVKAGLFSIDTDSVINGFELTSLQVSNNAISYFKQNVPTGYYKFKAYFYADENETLLLDTYKEIVVVADSCTSKKTIVIENLNKVCTVTYNTNGAGEIAGQSFTKFSDDIVLPTVARDGYTFEGWYTESTFDNKVTTIPADSGKDICLYASWGITVKLQLDPNPAPETRTLDSFATNSTLYNVVHYEGELSDENLTALCDSIPQNTILDLSKATGRDSIANKTIKQGSYISYFSSCKEVVLPECLTKIGTAAFYNCTLINQITILENVTSIGISAFYGCSSLKTITIPDGVTSIEGFSGCSSLQEITIPDTVTSIGSFAFSGCSSLQEITIPNSVTSIQYDAFLNCSSLHEIEIPASVTSIGSSAFEGCSSLQEITIPNSVISIGDEAFYYCRKLKIIQFTGTKSQWNTNWNSCFPSGATVYCTDGNISL